MTDETRRRTAATASIRPTAGAPLDRADVAAVIVAGGRSRRMGEPKAWLMLEGAPLLVHVGRAVWPLVREIVVVAAAGQDLPALDACGDATGRHGVAVRVHRDPVPDLGPLPALVEGLSAVTARAAFALGCDAPFIRAAVLAQLVEECADAEAAVPVWEGRVQPLVALYRRTLVGPLVALAASGERRLRAVASLPGVRLIPPERLAALDPDGASFRAINTPEDFAAAVAHARACRATD